MRARAPADGPDAIARIRYDANMSELTVESAYARLHSQYRGDLRFDEHLRPVRYVIVPDGTLIISAMAAMLTGFNMVLFVPEHVDGALQLQVTLEPFDEESSEGGGFADRWRIYHGEPEDVYWGKLYIDAARYDEFVVDGDALMRVDPLEKDLARLCKLINAEHRDDVRLLCERIAKTDVAEPVVVGIDSYGFDVRRRFDVVRVSFDSPQESGDGAMNELKRMAAEAGEH